MVTTPQNRLPNAPSAAQRPSHQTERIVQSITSAIADRRLKPGTKLTEQKLADIFEVSRTIVRQALNQLSRDRLVTLAPARGAFVASPTVQEAHDVFDVRVMLETSAVAQLCQRITPAQITRLRHHLGHEQALIHETNVSQRTRLLGDFHWLLASLLGNHVLTDLLTDLLNRSTLIALMYPSSPCAEHAHGEHAQLVDALEKRDAGLAVELMRQHLEQLKYSLRIDPDSTDLVDVFTHSLGSSLAAGLT